MMKKITFLLIMTLSCQFIFAQPTTDPVTPPDRNPNDVVSIYGDTYANIAVGNFNPYWGQSGSVDTQFETGSGNLVLAYTNFNYQGTEFGFSVNCANMEYLHIDIYTEDATVVKVSPINNGTGLSEILVNVPLITSGWSSVDLPIGDFTGMTWDSVFQLKFAAEGVVPCNIYLDNIYFWKSPVSSAADATVTSIEVEGTPLTNFSTASINYTHHLVIGTTSVPQITNVVTTSSTASITSITQASAIPGDAVIVVTSEDLSDTKTYTVSFVADIPTPCPTPNTPDNEVLSIYGDTGGFTNIWTSDYSFGGLSDEPDLDPTADVNKAMKIDLDVTIYGEGTLSGVVTDVTQYDYINFDYFASANTDQIQFTLIEDDGGVAEYYYELSATGSAPLAFETWTTISIPLSYFENLGFSKDKFFQYKIGSLGGMVGIAYFDNVYFSVNQTVMGVDEVTDVTLKAYPNPTVDQWTIESSGEKIITTLVFDVSGNKVLTVSPNASKVKLNALGLAKGLYFVHIKTVSGEQTFKLIKN